MGCRERHGGLDMDKGGARLQIEGNEMEEWIEDRRGMLGGGKLKEGCFRLWGKNI